MHLHPLIKLWIALAGAAALICVNAVMGNATSQLARDLTVAASLFLVVSFVVGFPALMTDTFPNWAFGSGYRSRRRRRRGKMIYAKACLGTIGYWMMFAGLWQFAIGRNAAGLLLFCVGNVLCFMAIVALAKYYFRRLAVEYAANGGQRVWKYVRNRYGL